MNLFRRAMPRDIFSGPAAALVIALLMAAYVAGYAWSAPNTDSADELLRAYEIRHAIAFPLEGPPLGGVLHLGPFWFYLTAAPLFIEHSWLAAALFIGFVCSLKFPLAYWCGKRLMDEDFGVLWAAALFLPGWTTVEQLVFLNPNGVAMAMLAVLAIALPGFERPAKSFQPGSGALVAELRSTIQSRDLVFSKDAASSKTQATYVVNKAEVGKAVTASFNLTHK